MPRGRSDRESSGVPIAVQIFCLFTGALIVAQGFNLAVVLLLPPPRPQLYRLPEIASAIQGRSLETRYGRPLIRSVAAPPLSHGAQALSDARELAALLATPPSRVRFKMEARWPPPLPGEPSDQGAQPPIPFPGAFPATPEAGEPGRGPAAGPEPAQRPIIGGFVAAAQQPSGAWIVVRPKPEPFPNAWQWAIMLGFSGCVALFSLAGWLFARRLTAPIGAFAAAAERLGRDPHAPPMILKGPAELGVAARTFNAMQVRIRRYVEDRTAMVGAISHDLRTPLMRIRFKMEGAAPPLRAAVLDDVSQMEAMISAVLVFIRDVNTPAKRERLDLLSLLECEVDAAALVGADVAMLESPPVIVYAEAVGLRRLFANLIDNAVKYGLQARVNLRIEGDEAVAEVIDKGPGLATHEIERVFQPFYRADPSRNRDTGGVGLGLSVARSIARAHGGDVTLATGSPGLIATVRLPLLFAD